MTERADTASSVAPAPQAREHEVLTAVQEVLAELVPHPPGSAATAFAPEGHILDLGVSSIQLLQIHAHLETRMGVEFPKAALFDCETIAELVRYLAWLPSAGATR